MSSASQHYTFAHQRLRDTALRQGAQLPGLIEAGLAQGVLQEEWALAGQHLPATRRRPATGLSTSLREAVSHRIALIALPEPHEAMEAYFCAVTVDRDTQQIRYFALDKALDLGALLALSGDAGTGTELSEWTRDLHVNWGPGPRPDLNEFAARVDQIATRGS
ncbi:hypothetical protein GCM10022227_13780 [Streptomyces sedi]